MTSEVLSYDENTSDFIDPIHQASEEDIIDKDKGALKKKEEVVNVPKNE